MSQLSFILDTDPPPPPAKPLHRCRPMTLADETAACCRWYEGAFVWELENVRPVMPFAVKGHQGIMNVEDEFITYL